LYGLEAIERDDDIAIVYVKKTPIGDGCEYTVFKSLAEHGITADVVLKTLSDDVTAEFVFTVALKDAEKCREILSEKHKAEITLIDICENVSLIGISGGGFMGDAETASVVFKCLMAADVRIIHVSINEMKISLIVEREDAHKAVATLLENFELNA